MINHCDKSFKQLLDSLIDFNTRIFKNSKGSDVNDSKIKNWG